MKRVRRQTPPGQFSDPLSDYSAPDYEDDLERSLMEETIASAMTYQPYKTVSIDTTVIDTMKIMAEMGIACIMVTDNGKLVGIFSERDVLNRVIDDFNNVKNQPISSLMTPDPIAVHENDCPAKALNQMAVGGFRHVPVLTVDERIAGILGPRRVVKYIEDRLR